MRTRATKNRRQSSQSQALAFNPLVARWTAENRKAQGEVAAELGVSASYVSMVLRGLRKSRGGVVERELKRRGAPLEEQI